jgi:hypothetical protein
MGKLRSRRVCLEDVAWCLKDVWGGFGFEKLQIIHPYKTYVTNSEEEHKIRHASFTDSLAHSF